MRAITLAALIAGTLTVATPVLSDDELMFNHLAT
jgi:hypothetical protein